MAMKMFGSFVSSPNILINVPTSILLLDYILASSLCFFLFITGALRFLQAKNQRFSKSCITTVYNSTCILIGQVKFTTSNP